LTRFIQSGGKTIQLLNSRDHFQPEDAFVCFLNHNAELREELALRSCASHRAMVGTNAAGSVSQLIRDATEPGNPLEAGAKLDDADCELLGSLLQAIQLVDSHALPFRKRRTVSDFSEIRQSMKRDCGFRNVGKRRRCQNCNAAPPQPGSARS
jgi:hypothetical protein